MKNLFKGKQILITGGSGSIGTELVYQLLGFEPKIIRILSNDEDGQFNLQQKLKDKKNVRFLIGDVRDKDRIKRAIEGINIVYHVAALKHVPFCEYNPLEAVQTNVIGTKNVIEACLEEPNVELMVNISTDKAANPISTMGATKLLAEKLTTWATFYRPKRKPIFTSVRFGNVLNSRGSIVPLFKEQIKNGGPVTLTDDNMRRFIMPIPESVKLILNASRLAKGGEIFVLKMPAIKIRDLIEAMIKNLAEKYGYKPKDIKIKRIGIRSGEKLDELLMTEEEARDVLETEDMFIILPKVQLPYLDVSGYKYPDSKRSARKDYTSKDAKLLDKKELKKLLSKEGIL